MLSKEAQAVVGKVHDNTRPALKLLESEGFRFRGFVDIFDAGPTVEAEVCNLNSVRNSRLVTVTVSGSTAEDEGIPHIVCNTQLENFRATKLSLPAGADELILTTEQARAMHLESGDEARIVAL